MRVQRCTVFLLAAAVMAMTAAAQALSADWTKDPVERRVRATYSIRLAVNDPAHAHFWFAPPRSHSMQIVIAGPRFDREPTRTFQDDAFGNRISYWSFGETGELALTMESELLVKNVLTDLDPEKVGTYDPEDPEYQLYTRSERLTHLNAGILAIKAEIEGKLGGDRHPLSIVRATYQWVLDHMAYALLSDLGRDRGTDALLANPYEHGDLVYYKGDCGEYTLLFNAVLRAFGIPARTVTGGWSILENQWHVWSEILLPGYGWVPVDTSAADVFVYDEGEERNALGRKTLGAFPEVRSPNFYLGNLDPFRFVLSVGSDIALEPALDWDFSPYNLGWFYQRGIAGYLQVGIFHVESRLKSLSMRFEDLDS